MTSEEIPLIEVTLDWNATNHEILSLVQHIRPQWKSVEDIVIEPLTGGFINKILVVHLKSDGDREDAIVMRINNSDRIYVLDPSDEVIGFKLAQKAGSCSHIYAFFENGCLQRYLHQLPLQAMDIFKDKYCRKVVKQLAKLHNMKPTFDLLPENVSREICILQRIELTLDHVPHPGVNSRIDNILVKHDISKDKLEKEFELVKAYFEPGSMEVIFSHGDFRADNIIVEKETEQVHLIDYEFSGPCYDAYDFSYIVESLHAFIIIESQPNEKPTVDDIKKLLRYYLEERAVLKGGGHKDVTESTVEEFYKNTLKMAPVYSLYALAFWICELYNRLLDSIPECKWIQLLEEYQIIYRQQIHRIMPVELSCV